MEIVCRAQNNGSADLKFLLSFIAVEAVMVAAKSLFGLVMMLNYVLVVWDLYIGYLMGSFSSETDILGKGPEHTGMFVAVAGKNKAEPENKDAGDSEDDDDEDDEDGGGEDDQDDDAGEEDSGDEGKGNEGDENNDPEVNGEGGSEDDDNNDEDDEEDDEDDDEDDDDDGDEEDEEEDDEDDEEDIPQPPAKRRK